MILLIAGSFVGCRKHSDPVLILPPEHTTSVIQLQPIKIDEIESVRVSTGSEAGELTMLEIIGSGVGCFDYDLDGLCDLYFPCGGDIQDDDQVDGEKAGQQRILGRPSRLLRNLGNDQVDDVSQASRALAERLFAHGVTSSDFDHDGMPDLLVYGYHGVALYRNLGDGTFDDVTESMGLQGIPWTTSVAWFDANHDGYLDIYGAAYVNWSFDNHPKCEGWWGGELDCTDRGHR